jgi:hypothetical protein
VLVTSPCFATLTPKNGRQKDNEVLNITASEKKKLKINYGPTIQRTNGIENNASISSAT